MTIPKSPKKKKKQQQQGRRAGARGGRGAGRETYLHQLVEAWHFCSSCSTTAPLSWRTAFEILPLLTTPRTRSKPPTMLRTASHRSVYFLHGDHGGINMYAPASRSTRDRQLRALLNELGTVLSGQCCTLFGLGVACCGVCLSSCGTLL